MVCVGPIDAAITGAKNAAKAQKGQYDSAMGNLRALDPSGFDTREEYEEAKKQAIEDGKGALESYIGSIDVVNQVASALSAIDGFALDAMAVANGGGMLALLALIPDAPGSLAPITAAVTAMQSLQC